MVFLFMHSFSKKITELGVVAEAGGLKLKASVGNTVSLIPKKTKTIQSAWSVTDTRVGMRDKQSQALPSELTVERQVRG